MFKKWHTILKSRVLVVIFVVAGCGCVSDLLSANAAVSLFFFLSKRNFCHNFSKGCNFVSKQTSPLALTDFFLLDVSGINCLLTNEEVTSFWKIMVASTISLSRYFFRKREREESAAQVRERDCSRERGLQPRESNQKWVVFLRKMGESNDKRVYVCECKTVPDGMRGSKWNTYNDDESVWF